MPKPDFAIDLHNHIMLMGAFEKLKDKYPKLVPRIESEPNGLYTVITGDHKVRH
ncbi:MAG TPA: hypothetical protein VMW36_05680 [Patescibacteria group bacterium]|nr:hypothetical protein [Patescibacteria group bacterium]